MSGRRVTRSAQILQPNLLYYAFILTNSVFDIMFEINPIQNHIKELQGRVEALRGYL